MKESIAPNEPFAVLNRNKNRRNVFFNFVGNICYHLHQKIRTIRQKFIWKKNVLLSSFRKRSWNILVTIGLKAARKSTSCPLKMRQFLFVFFKFSAAKLSRARNFWWSTTTLSIDICKKRSVRINNFWVVGRQTWKKQWAINVFLMTFRNPWREKNW